MPKMEEENGKTRFFLFLENLFVKRIILKIAR
jgi:hypothetical protein